MLSKKTKTINQKSYIWPTLLHGLTVLKMTKWIAAVLVIIMSHYECGPIEYKLKGGMKLVKRKKPKTICSVGYHRDKDPENHFREQLMLYTLWQKESTDLTRLSNFPRTVGRS